jgi:hypothetical protein
MYLNGMGLRAIERVTEIHHTTVMHWIRETAATLPEAPQTEEHPEITDLDELQTHSSLNAFRLEWGVPSAHLLAAKRTSTDCGVRSIIGNQVF